MERIYLSTVTPVYQGAQYLRELVAALESVRNELGAQLLPVDLVESIFVNDEAVDDSEAVLSELQQTRPWLRVVHLSRNFGQHGATVAGILHSSGDWVVTLDEDLQHHPRHIITLLLQAVGGGFDVMYGASDRAVHRSAFRNLASRLYKRALSSMTGNPRILLFSSFRVVRGSIARAAGSVSTHDTYFDVVLNWFTDRISSLRLPLVDIRSVAGDPSGYSVRKLLQHARRMLISSDIKPLRIGSGLGAATLLLSIFLAVGIVVLKLLRPEVIELRGWASLIIAIAFFGGLTAFLLGVALEYLSTVVLHTLGKPTFFVVDRSKDALLLPFADSGTTQ